MQKQFCLVTGAKGFIGNRLCQRFQEMSVNYRGSTRNGESSGWLTVTGDLARFSDWSRLLNGCDTIIHLAAKVHAMGPQTDREYHQYNTDMTRTLAVKAKEFGVRRFIFLSSVKVNGESTDTSPFTADDTPAPQDAYGRSKKLAEEALLELHEPGKFEVVIIRPCLVYGPGVKANFYNLMKLVEKNWPLPFAAIRNKRSLLSVDNLINLMVTCMTHEKAGGEIFLASDGNDLSLPELITAIARSKNQNSRLWPVPQPLMNGFLRLVGKRQLAERLFGNLQVDISKNRNILGWTPPHTMDFTLRKM